MLFVREFLTLVTLRSGLIMSLIMAFAAVLLGSSARACDRTIKADVVALDQPFVWNRLGAAQPQGMSSYDRTNGPGH